MSERVEFRHAGLPCIAKVGPLGVWCGYVGVAPDHPWHGVEYSGCLAGQCEPWSCEHDTPSSLVNVHGGLTYSAACNESMGICHVPEPGEPDDVWWFGFDCGHAFDLIPGLPLPGAVFRDQDYVVAEIRRLAEQLVAVEGATR